MLSAVRLLVLLLAANAESAADVFDLPDLFLIQVAAQTFNGSGVKHALDSVNRTRSTALPNVSSSDREHSLLQSATQHRNGTAKNKDREKENDGSQIVQEQLGLKANSESDSEALRASFLFNIGLISAYLVLFVVFQRWKPLVYLHNTTIQKAPEPHPSWFGVWLSSEEVEEYAGLDSALMIEFCNLGMKICIYLGIPLTVVCLPVFYVMGKHPGAAAEKPEVFEAWRPIVIVLSFCAS